MGKLVEFCLNSKRYIILMTFKGKPPLTCPYREDNFMSCENCSYYLKKKPTKYFTKIIQAIKEYK